MNIKANINLYFILLIVILSSFIRFTSAQVWLPLGTGTNGTVHATMIYGSTLVAAGSFTVAGGQNVNHIARWNGTSWQALGIGTNDDIYALTVYNGNLIAGGKFTTAGGLTANRIAVWNGSAWSTLATGFDSDVYVLNVVYSDLIAGGKFNFAGSIVTKKIARWYNGWTTIGNGFNDEVYSLGVFGTQLYAGGKFTLSGSVSTKRIAFWNGAGWVPLGLGIDDGIAYALRLYGSSIAVGGSFTFIGGSIVNRVARWYGSSWGTIGSGFDNTVYALYPVGSNMYAGGSFNYADYLPASKVAVFNGTSWSAIGSGIGGSNPFVKTIIGYGGRVIFAGSFSTAGGNATNNIAAWGAPLGVQPVNGSIPEQYSLGQNYPNPFNPSTKIQFAIPAGSGTNMINVKIVVFNMLGKGIIELVNQHLEPGYYEVEFDGGNLPSGTYFYKLLSDNVSYTKRMVLLK